MTANRPLSLGGGIPKICIPVVGNTEDVFLSNLNAAVAARPDLIELRIDTLSSAEPEQAVHRAISVTENIPLLLTLRSTRDGGQGSPETYHDLLWQMLDHSPGISLIDLEISAGEAVFTSLRQKARELGIRVIGSWHSFSGTPDEETLLSRFTRIEAFGADIAKVAVMPQTALDVDRLCTCAKRAHALLQIPIIAISMGELGMRTRITGECFGSCLTFASAGTESAPGQMPAAAVRAALLQQHEQLNQKG